MDFRIPEPCEQSWDAMEPRPGGRYCDHCDHTVVDLSTVSRAQAEARLSRSRAAYVCVRLAVDEQDAPVFIAPPRRAPHFVGGLVLVAGLTAGGCDVDEPTGSAEITAVADDPDAPCTLGAGPPMLPVDQFDPRDPPADDLLVTGPVHAIVDAGSGSPNAEQRALTEAKHRPPPIRHLAGRMPLRHPLSTP